MHTYKHATNWYVAQYTNAKGQTFVEFGRTHLEAIMNCFTRIKYNK